MSSIIFFFINKDNKVNTWVSIVKCIVSVDNYSKDLSSAS